MDLLLYIYAHYLDLKCCKQYLYFISHHVYTYNRSSFAGCLLCINWNYRILWKYWNLKIELRSCLLRRSHCEPFACSANSKLPRPEVKLNTDFNNHPELLPFLAGGGGWGRELEAPDGLHRSTQLLQSAAVGLVGSQLLHRGEPAPQTWELRQGKHEIDGAQCGHDG